MIYVTIDRFQSYLSLSFQNNICDNQRGLQVGKSIHLASVYNYLVNQLWLVVLKSNNSTKFSYLFGRYKLLQVLVFANLRYHKSRAITAWRQFRIPSVVTFSVTCLAQSWRGRPFLRLPPSGSDSKTTNWVAAIHRSHMTHPSKTLYLYTLYLYYFHTSMSS